jgi:hypothetical protein
VLCCPPPLHTLQKLEELKRAQEEELEDRLDAGVKRVLAANRRLAEELHLHVTVRSGRKQQKQRFHCASAHAMMANDWSFA